jgi:tetratricopeptide (TPR) repeat protein
MSTGRRVVCIAVCIGVGASVAAGCAKRRTTPTPPFATGGTVDEARELTRQGDAAFDRGDYVGAEAFYRRSLGILREQPGALNNLGNALAAMGRRVDADEVFKQAIAADDSRPEAYGNRGRLWLDAGYPRDAATYFDQALRIDPKWLPALRGKAKAGHLQSTVDEAYLDVLRRAYILETDPQWRAFFDRERSRVQQAIDAES